MDLNKREPAAIGSRVFAVARGRRARTSQNFPYFTHGAKRILRSFYQGPAPTRGIDIIEGLRKSPDVAFEILGSVLTFAKFIALDRANDVNSFRYNLAIVFVDILDPHENRMRRVDVSRGGVALGDDEGAAAADVQLHAMIGNAQALLKTKMLAEPFRRAGHVGVGEFRNDRGIRDGAIWAQGWFGFHLVMLFPGGFFKVGGYEVGFNFHAFFIFLNTIRHDWVRLSTIAKAVRPRVRCSR